MKPWTNLRALAVAIQQTKQLPLPGLDVCPANDGPLTDKQYAAAARGVVRAIEVAVDGRQP